MIMMEDVSHSSSGCHESRGHRGALVSLLSNFLQSKAKTSTLMEAKTRTMEKEIFMANLYGLLSLSTNVRIG